jgi:hypothetical protein
MKDPLDPRVDQLIAALYGELSAEERARFEKQLESDPVLRAEWEELHLARRYLSAWELEERVPSFVLVDQKPSPAAAIGARAETRWWSVFRRPLPAVGWAFAAAAVVFAILIAAQARIDLLDRGIAFRFGPPALVENQASPASPASRDGDAGPAETAADEPRPASAVESDEPVPTLAQVASSTPADEWVVSQDDSLQVRLRSAESAGTDLPMTRREFEAYTAGMAKVIAAMQSRNDYNLRQSEDFLAFVRSMYEGLSERQADNYYELRGRIEAVRYGLTEVETTTNDRLDMIDLREGEPLSPGVRSSEPKKENEDE